MTTYRIETERLVIRCWEPKDAPLLKSAIDSSLDHLLPWMPWAKHEPQTLSEKVELLRMFRGKFDLDQDSVLGIFNRDESEVWGGTGLHPRRGENEREIGYWVRVDKANQGVITEATSALVKVGFELERFHRLEIRCDPENLASSAVPRKLGFRHEATLRKHMLAGHNEPRDIMIWSMLRDEYQGTPSEHIDLAAYNVIGEKI